MELNNFTFLSFIFLVASVFIFLQRDEIFISQRTEKLTSEKVFITEDKVKQIRNFSGENDLADLFKNGDSENEANASDLLVSNDENDETEISAAENVILLTAHRSGSSFLGEYFNQNKDIFYAWFELN